MSYDPDKIRVLASSAEAIRTRPEMYVGRLDDPLLMNKLIQESLCIAADEAMAGRCDRVRVEVYGDGMTSVRDRGRGLPMTLDAAGRPLAESLLTQLFACREHKEHGRIAESCCQAGLVAVNALSDWLRIKNFREGACWSQSYRRGEPLGPFQRQPSVCESGVELTFRPDSAILGPLQFDGRALADWFIGLGLRCSSVEIGTGRSGGGPAFVCFEGIAPGQSTHP